MLTWLQRTITTSRSAAAVEAEEGEGPWMVAVAVSAATGMFTLICISLCHTNVFIAAVAAATSRQLSIAKFPPEQQ